MTLPSAHPLNTGTTAQSAFIQNCRGNRTTHLPIWFMRQAGRSLPEYRQARAHTTMLQSCVEPSIAAELTMQPVRRYGVDAAIFFSDIVVPLKLAGVPVAIVPGVGPVFDHPVRTPDDFTQLPPLNADQLTPIFEAVALLTPELGGTPLIGFGAAPFTLASYLIEGGPAPQMPHVRALMRNHPQLWHNILGWCAQITAAFITTQVNAGASALQVFDSWAGRLTQNEYRTYAQPHTTALFAALSSLEDQHGAPVPRIHFGVGTRTLLRPMHTAGATVMGVGSDTPLNTATQMLGPTVPLQGNIAPTILTQPWPTIETHVRSVLRNGAQAPGHIVNLGHGVPPRTDPSVLQRITDFVHDYRA